MSDQDTLHTLSLVNDQVSDTPPEPENGGNAAKVQNGEVTVSAEAGQADAGLETETLSEQGGADTMQQTPSDRQEERGPEDAQDSSGQNAPEPGVQAEDGRVQNGMGNGGQPWGPNGFNGSGGQGTPPPPGWQYNNGMGQQRKKNNNTMAMASLVLGILSVLLCCCGGFGIILGAIGIVLAILSRGREPMETSAKVGIGLSIGGIVLSIIVLVMAFAVVGNNEFYDFYQRGYGNYEDYEDFSHYFDHNGM